MKLTKRKVDGLTIPEGKEDFIVYDDELPGFGVRLRAGGSRVWVYSYKFGAKHRRITLGPVAALTPQEARKTVMGLMAKVRLGIDPQAEKLAARAAAGQQGGIKSENARLRKLLTDALLENAVLKERLTKK